MDFILRPFEQGDVSALAAAANDPKVAAKLRNVFPNPYTEIDARGYISACIAREGDRQLVRAIVADGRAVGSVGVFVQDDVYEKSAELGYWLSRDFWGRGIMTRAVRELCEQAFSRFDIVRIYAQPFADNTGSCRVLEKAGFTLEGTLRDSVYKNGELHSSRMYSLLRGECS